MSPKGRKRPGKTISLTIPIWGPPQMAKFRYRQASVKNIRQKGDIYGRNRRKAYENLSKKYYYD